MSEKYKLQSQIGKDFIEDYISHYGVKGMRWGVRKSRAEITTTESVNMPNASKKDKKWAESKAVLRNTQKINFLVNRMAIEDLEGINAKYAKADLGYDWDKKQYLTADGKKYIKEIETTLNKHAAVAVDSMIGGRSPSGSYKLDVKYKPEEEWGMAEINIVPVERNE